MSGSAAVFLDRDGVLNELVYDRVSRAPESPLRIEDVRLLGGVGAALVRLERAGFLLACVSNQPAAAKGTVSLERLYAVHARVLELLAQQGVRLAAWRLCTHHPAGILTELSGPCACRKPAPGMLLDIAADLGIDLHTSWMVGDTDADIGAGRAAGCRTALIDYPGSAHKRKERMRQNLRAPSLTGAVAQICDVAVDRVGDSEIDEMSSRALKKTANKR